MARMRWMAAALPVVAMLSVAPPAAAQTGPAGTDSSTTSTTPSTSSTTAPTVYSTWWTLRAGSSGARVAAVQRALISRGYSLRGGADGNYGYYTSRAVSLFQSRNGLTVTGTANLATARKMGVTTATTSGSGGSSGSGGGSTPPPTGTKDCPTTPHAAVIDRDRQRAWLCDHGKPLAEFVITSARSQPDPGRYKVYSKSVNAYSYASGSYTTMTYFTAFARGEQSGARVGFHSVPKYRSGAYIQPLSSVGSMAMFGKTAGCVRTLPQQAAVIYRWLAIGDPVVVIS